MKTDWEVYLVSLEECQSWSSKVSFVTFWSILLNCSPLCDDLLNFQKKKKWVAKSSEAWSRRSASVDLNWSEAKTANSSGTSSHSAVRSKITAAFFISDISHMLTTSMKTPMLDSQNTKHTSLHFTSLMSFMAERSPNTKTDKNGDSTEPHSKAVEVHYL